METNKENESAQSKLVRTKKCKHCKSEIDFKAKVCPVCKRKQANGCLTAILVVVGLLVVIGIIGSIGDDKKQTSTVTTASTDNKANVQEETAVETSTENTFEEAEQSSENNVSDISETEPETPAQAPTLSMGQSNALSKAVDYLNVSAFSYSGLIKQLEYEQFSTEDATYAADNCGADWNEQAAKKAQEYLDVSSFSRSSLIEQLKYEEFTQEQAEYGVSAAGY